jgi:hypothetical protein
VNGTGAWMIFSVKMDIFLWMLTSVCIKKVGNTVALTIGVFVDDIVIAGKDILEIAKFKKTLRLGGPMFCDLRSRIEVHTIRIPGGCQNLGNSSLCEMEKF